MAHPILELRPGHDSCPIFSYLRGRVQATLNTMVGKKYLTRSKQGNMYLFAPRSSLNWDSGWLPAVYRGTEFQSQGSPVLNLYPAVELPAGSQKADLDLLARLNEGHRRRFPLEGDLEARIRHYELAARMQISAKRTLDLASETEATQKMYGMDQPATADYGKRCLMARRLVESGVRHFVPRPRCPE